MQKIQHALKKYLSCDYDVAKLWQGDICDMTVASYNCQYKVSAMELLCTLKQLSYNGGCD